MLIKRTHKRLFHIDTGKKDIDTPFFFPAISSIKTNFSIEEYLSLIRKIGYPGFLASSYDIFNSKKTKDKIINVISESTEGNFITLLDSGHYEAFWYHDRNWSFKMFESVLNKIVVDFCFSYDIFWGEKTKKQQYIKETITSIAKTAGMQKIGTTIPLIHSKPESFPDIIKGIVEIINPEVIAIPERELGAGIFERAFTVREIRNALDKTNRQILIHLLGTGNPISLLIYTMCGADLYDGLEWCQTVVNPKTGHLFHFAQKDLIDCNCNACKIKDIPYPMQTMAHNLLFYRRFIDEIQSSIKENKEDSILEKYLGPKNSKKFKKIVGKK